MAFPWIVRGCDGPASSGRIGRRGVDSCQARGAGRLSLSGPVRGRRVRTDLAMVNVMFERVGRILPVSSLRGDRDARLQEAFEEEA